MGWRDLERFMDIIVDEFFAEPIELHPWIAADYNDPGHADSARKVVKTIGCYVMPGAKAVGESGTVSSGMAARTVENSVWVSITEDNIGDINAWKQHDRVYLPERNAWFSIEKPVPSATGRPQFDLIRLQVGSL